jgi:RHS repeat-associated protein
MPRSHGSPALLAAVRATVSGGGTKLSWLFTDHHGTALVTIDATTHTASRRRVNPFGVLRNNPAWPTTRSFVGGYGNNTIATGMVHLGAREYDPAIGRFMSVDPLLAPKDPQSLTGYGYASNNPVTLADSSGKMPSEEGAGCGGCSPSSGPPIPTDIDAPWPEQDLSVETAFQGPATCGIFCVAEVRCIGCNPNPFTELAMMAIPFSDVPGCLRRNKVDCAFATMDAIPIGGILLGAGRRLFKSSDEAAKAVKGAYTLAAPSLVWKMDPFNRGRKIEEMLGANLASPNYPVIDKWDAKTGTATSIKSLDLNTPTRMDPAILEKTLNGYVDAVAGFNGRGQWGAVKPIARQQIRQRALQVAIPRMPNTKAEEELLAKVAKRAHDLKPNVYVEYVVIR